MQAHVDTDVSEVQSSSLTFDLEKAERDLGLELDGMTDSIDIDGSSDVDKGLQYSPGNNSANSRAVVDDQEEDDKVSGRNNDENKDNVEWTDAETSILEGHIEPIHEGIDDQEEEKQETTQKKITRGARTKLPIGRRLSTHQHDEDDHMESQRKPSVKINNAKSSSTQVPPKLIREFDSATAKWEVSILKGNKWKRETIRISKRVLVLDQSNQPILTLKRIKSIKLGKVSKKLRRKSTGIDGKLDELFISITSTGVNRAKSYLQVMNKDERPFIVSSIMQRVAELNGAPISVEESGVILQTMKDMGPNECFSFRFDMVQHNGWYPAWSPKQSRSESVTSAYSNSSDKDVAWRDAEMSKLVGHSEHISRGPVGVEEEAEHQGITGNVSGNKGSSSKLPVCDRLSTHRALTDVETSFLNGHIEHVGKGTVGQEEEKQETTQKTMRSGARAQLPICTRLSTHLHVGNDGNHSSDRTHSEEKGFASNREVVSKKDDRPKIGIRVGGRAQRHFKKIKIRLIKYAATNDQLTELPFRAQPIPFNQSIINDNYNKEIAYIEYETKRFIDAVEKQERLLNEIVRWSRWS